MPGATKEQLKKASDKGIKSPRIGKRGKSKSTLEKEKKEMTLREQMDNVAREKFDDLLGSQYTLAFGFSVMFANAYQMNKKTGKRERKGKWEQITDVKEIGALLNEDDGDYYRIYTKDPEGRAGQYLIDQSIGKPKDRLEHSGPGGGPIKVDLDFDISLNKAYGKDLTADKTTT